MLFFLLSAFFMVSAGKESTIERFVGDDVLLKCECLDRNLNQDFKWQLEEDKKKGTQTKLIFKYNRTSNVTDNQFETFLNKDRSNCSMLLKNITSDSEGEYTCRFHSHTTYRHESVTLKVCGQNISQYSHSTPGGGKIYHCDVKLDCDREPNIQWTLNGRCLTNSPTNNITTPNNTGHYHFRSTFETTSTDGSKPKCEVNPVCLLDSSSPQDPNQQPDFSLKMLCKVVPVVLILGFLLIWYRRRHGPSHGLPSERDVENSDSSETSTSSEKTSKSKSTFFLS